MSLPYRTSLVTGASRGIGAALTRRLTSLGFTVYAVGRSRDALEELATDSGALPIVADVRDCAAIMAALGGEAIDVLVNNAGTIPAVKPLQHLSPSDIDSMIDVNLRAPLQLMRALLPGMIERRRGHIVNIGSIAAHHVFAGTAPYAGAKAGLSAVGRVMRYDLAGSGIRLTELSLGRVETDIYLAAFDNDRERLSSSLYDGVRPIRPEDVAEAIVAVLALPEQVDASFVEMMPTDQATGGYVYASRSKR